MRTTNNRQWAISYWNYMMREQWEEGFAIKMKHFPQSLYKYRPLNSRTLESIEKGEIWLAEMASLNDPFECSLQFDNDECLRLFFSDYKFQVTFKEKTGVELTLNEINGIKLSPDPYATYINICSSKGITINISSKEHLEKVQRRWIEIIEETNKEIKVTCFSEFNDSLLMWAHYGNEHKGICLEYDFIDDDKIRPFLQPIIYSEQVYKVGLFEELTPLRKIGSTLIKSKDWEYEGEWRFTAIRQGEYFPNKISVPQPKAVYLGARFHLNSENEKERLFQVLKQKEIPSFQMVKHPSEYRLIAQVEKKSLNESILGRKH